MKKIIVFVALVLLGVGVIFYLGKKKSDNNKLINKICNQNEGDIIFGDFNASKSLIVYFDYNCSFCKRFFDTSYDRLNEKYIKTGRLKLILRLVCSIGDKQAKDAYQTAICYSKNGEYQTLHDLLMHQSTVIYTEEFRKLRDDIMYNNEAIAECVLGSENKEINQNIKQFLMLKAGGTPTFIINNKVIVGYKDYEFIEKVLEKEYVLN